MKTNNKPIGLFDSGIGGTSIWKAVNDLLPNENTIYLADSKNAPYGKKSKQEILQLCIKNTEQLLDFNCKMILVACNTATTNAIVALRSKYNIPFIGIEPAIKPAALNSKTKTIGVLATKGTITSELFNKTVEFFQEITIIEQIGYGIVELIENGDLDSPEMTSLLKSYIQPMIAKNIDFLVLGCSHYPYLIPQLEKILPKHIQIIDSGQAVARQTYRIINEKVGFSSTIKGHAVFYSNSNPDVLAKILKNKESVLELDF